MIPPDTRKQTRLFHSHGKGRDHNGQRAPIFSSPRWKTSVSSAFSACPARRTSTSSSRCEPPSSCLTRHEQAAAFMAATYGRLTGKPGVCLSTLGPGALNFTTAAAYALLGAMPMVMITGQKGILSAAGAASRWSTRCRDAPADQDDAPDRQPPTHPAWCATPSASRRRSAPDPCIWNCRRTSPARTPRMRRSRRIRSTCRWRTRNALDAAAS